MTRDARYSRPTHRQLQPRLDTMEAWQVQALGILISILITGGGAYTAFRVALTEMKGEIKEAKAEINGLLAEIRSDSKANREKLQTQLDTAIVQIGKLEQWTKDKERFDHEFRHDEYGKAITTINFTLWPLDVQMKAVIKDLEDLRGWKHLTVDPYIPRAVDEHERRINRLDLKVFNGGSHKP